VKPDPFGWIAIDIRIDAFIRTAISPNSQVRTNLRIELFRPYGIRARGFTLKSKRLWEIFAETSFAPRKRGGTGKTYSFNEWVNERGWVQEKEPDPKKFTILWNTRDILFVTAWDNQKDIRFIVDGFHRASAIKYQNLSPEVLSPFQVVECYGNMDDISEDHETFDHD
jgi:hypothetical protein